MKDVMKYKGFIGSVHFSMEDEVFFGKLQGVNDLVTFEGKSVSELIESFQQAVEDYVLLCERIQKDPYKSFKGTFNIRIQPDLHKKAYQMALMEGVSLNQFVQEAIEFHVEEKSPPYIASSKEGRKK